MLLRLPGVHRVHLDLLEQRVKMASPVCQAKMEMQELLDKPLWVIWLRPVSSVQRDHLVLQDRTVLLVQADLLETQEPTELAVAAANLVQLAHQDHQDLTVILAQLERLVRLAHLE